MENILKTRPFAFTGGGTGGHIFPGLAVLEELKERSGLPGNSFVWIGSRNKLEKKLVEGSSISYYSIPSGKFRRYFSLKNFTDLFRIAAGVVVSIYILSRLKPRLLFSKGGYVSVPPILAAKLLKIPVWVHESDLDPGLATRLGSRWAERIYVSYEVSRRFFPEALQERIVLSGNPVRKAIYGGSREEGRRIAGCEGNEPLLLVLGGSQGARQINLLIEEILPQLLKRCRIVHQMGKEGFKPSRLEGYLTAPFFSDELPHLLAAADLVVCRAGAGTLWENAVLGKPAVLIPLGAGSSRGDQLRNAGYFAASGAAEILDPSKAEGENLKKRILGLLENPELLYQMGSKAKKLAPQKASELIVSDIMDSKGE